MFKICHNGICNIGYAVPARAYVNAKELRCFELIVCRVDVRVGCGGVKKGY